MQESHRSPRHRKGPLIRAVFHVEEKGIKEVKLSPSLEMDGMEWEIQGKASPLLRTCLKSFDRV